MKTSLIPHIAAAHPEVQVNSVEPDGIYIGRALDTASSAANYAQQLNDEFRLNLMEPLQAANPKLAARYVSLIGELCFMADVTVRNIKRGAK